MIPFFVADRPMSLRLLKGLPFQDYPGVRIGIMAHANTTLNFQRALLEYPCEDLDHCDAVGGSCQYRGRFCLCPVREYILNHTVKMCDSGIFTRDGATLTYDELFEAYDRMGVEYGVMIDIFRDASGTLESAEKALQAYTPFEDSFRLVAVAQGNTLEEYFECYAQLRRLGFNYIAVGGLLRRRKNTVRFPYVRGQEFMSQVLGQLRDQYPNDWLFALGCLHAKRLPLLKELDIWADYKGWVFQYDKRSEAVNSYLELFICNHLKHLNSDEAGDHVSRLRHLIAHRRNLVAEQRTLFKQLIDGRRVLRRRLSSLHQELRQKMPEMEERFERLTTHGLLDDTEEKIVRKALDILGEEGSEEAACILANIQGNRDLKQDIDSTEDAVDSANHVLARQIRRLLADGACLSDEAIQLCARMVGVIERTEREHRANQVRDRIASEILAHLS